MADSFGWQAWYDHPVVELKVRRALGVIFILLPIAVGLLVSTLLAFRWAVRDGQFDDLDTPPLRVLLEEPERETTHETGGEVR